MTYDTFIGVDPGKSGATACISAGGVEWVRHDGTERDVIDFFEQLSWHRPFALLERVNAMPKQGVSSMFKFGQSYGFLRACLLSCGIPFEVITPVQWQRKMSCLSGGDKNVTKGRAQELFPDTKIIHANADAILLAECCRRTYGRS